jgi:1-acyl-sn-glycerol-3-phosphate acyltransferase
MRIVALICNIKFKRRGKISDARPLLIVGNHISIFEFVTMPSAFGGNFFAKKEMKKIPLVGWAAKKMGVIYINRNPSAAKQEIERIDKNLSTATWPFVIFPEGTTTNGAYVKQFKSAMFNVIEPQLQGESKNPITVQPLVMHYRTKSGEKISDEDMAEHFAMFAPDKQDVVVPFIHEREWFRQIWHMCAIGGFTVELEFLPPQDLTGITNRKQLAEVLYKRVSDRYMENK